jgi:thiol-disulfide isomerase/thioredoxin
MSNFSKIINAALMVVVFTGLAGYFGNIRLSDMLPRPASDADASFAHKVQAFNASIDAEAAPAPQPKLLLETLDAEGFERIVLHSTDRPTFIMIYASWCPYCKRMFADLNRFALEFSGIRFVMLSIDETREPAERFVASAAPLHMESYIIKGAEEYYRMSEFIRSAGLGYQGGISKNVGVPYNMVFYQQKAVAELAGAVPTENLYALLQELSAGAAQKNSPNSQGN